MLLHDESASDHACLRKAGAAKAAVCWCFADRLARGTGSYVVSLNPVVPVL